MAKEPPAATRKPTRAGERPAPAAKSVSRAPKPPTRAPKPPTRASKPPTRASKPRTAKTDRTPKTAPAWKAHGAGAYRSADDRFSIAAEGSGRWFLRDDQEPDELGQPRTMGPYATLAGAKAAADEHRQRAPEESPLAARLSRRPVRAAAGRGTGTRGARATGRAGAPKPSGKAPATWLDRLTQKDRAAGRRARALVGALERIGVADAEAVVRRDVEGIRPAVAETVLAVAIRREIGRANDPARLLEAVLTVISMNERLTDDDRLPGWRLVESGERARRLHVTPADVLDKDR